MKKTVLFILLVLLTLVISACGQTTEIENAGLVTDSENHSVIAETPNSSSGTISNIPGQTSATESIFTVTPDLTTVPTLETTIVPKTDHPTDEPTTKDIVSDAPTQTTVSTSAPTASPTVKPTETPTNKPTQVPSITATVKPTATPTTKPTSIISSSPTPGITPTVKPTEKPTPTPTARPTDEPHVHSFGQWYVVIEATCTEDGYEECVCSCGERKTRTISKLGHDFGGDEYDNCVRCGLSLIDYYVSGNWLLRYYHDDFGDITDLTFLQAYMHCSYSDLSTDFGDGYAHVSLDKLRFDGGYDIRIMIQDSYGNTIVRNLSDTDTVYYDVSMKDSSGSVCSFTALMYPTQNMIRFENVYEQIVVDSIMNGTTKFIITQKDSPIHKYTFSLQTGNLKDEIGKLISQSARDEADY